MPSIFQRRARLLAGPKSRRAGTKAPPGCVRPGLGQPRSSYVPFFPKVLYRFDQSARNAWLRAARKVLRWLGSGLGLANSRAADRRDRRICRYRPCAGGNGNRFLTHKIVTGKIAWHRRTLVWFARRKFPRRRDASSGMPVRARAVAEATVQDRHRHDEAVFRFSVSKAGLHGRRALAGAPRAVGKIARGKINHR